MTNLEQFMQKTGLSGAEIEAFNKIQPAFTGKGDGEKSRQERLAQKLGLKRIPYYVEEDYDLSSEYMAQTHQKQEEKETEKTGFDPMAEYMKLALEA